MTQDEALRILEKNLNKKITVEFVRKEIGNDYESAKRNLFKLHKNSKQLGLNIEKGIVHYKTKIKFINGFTYFKKSKANYYMLID